MLRISDSFWDDYQSVNDLARCFCPVPLDTGESEKSTWASESIKYSTVLSSTIMRYGLAIAGSKIKIGHASGLIEDFAMQRMMANRRSHEASRFVDTR